MTLWPTSSTALDKYVPDLSVVLVLVSETVKIAIFKV